MSDAFILIGSCYYFFTVELKDIVADTSRISVTVIAMNTRATAGKEVAQVHSFLSPKIYISINTNNKQIIKINFYFKK